MKKLRKIRGQGLIELAEIHDAISKHRFRISDHAFDEAREDGILRQEIFHSLRNGKIIEEYHYEEPGRWPRYLIAGRDPDRKAIYSVWAYNRRIRWAVLVTVYRPKAKRKQRK